MTRPFDPTRASLTELCEALRAGAISTVELMEHTLASIARTHASLGAVVSRRPADELLAEARAAQARLDRREARPLEGIPLGVKDLEDAAGLVTTHGSRLFEGRVAAEDSTQVARLKAAGAIVVGKTNTAEFGHTALTKNLVHGVTRSPYDPERSPGGSSGGSAAALAAGVLPLVTAHDGGGSIRVPASYCGAFGLKPTHGRVPTGPAELWDESAAVVHGPLTRTTADAALVLDQIAGPDPGDPFSLPATGYRYVDRLEDALGPARRIAFSPDLGGIPVQADVADAVDEAAGVFREMGHQVHVVKGGPPDLGAYWGLLLGRRLDAWIGDDIARREGDVTRALVKAIEMARGLPPSYWGQQARARMDAVRWFASVLAEHDLLLTPTVPCDPPPAKGPLPTHVGSAALPVAGVAAFTLPVNLAWLPAATVRCGASRAGFPVGLQIVGRRGADDQVLAAARAFERRRPWHPHWPVLG